MKIKSMYRGIALLAVTLTATACQNELQEENTDPKPGEKIVMTIRATQGAAPQTRTSYEDDMDAATNRKIIVKWGGGTDDTAVDSIDVYQVGKNTEYIYCGTLTSKPETRSDDGKIIDFTGTVSATPRIAIYPAGKGKPYEKDGLQFIFTDQTQDCTPGKEMAHLKDYDIMRGQIESTTNGITKYKFTHQAITIRFKLTLPTGLTDEIKKVTLSTSKYGEDTYEISTGLVLYAYEHKAPKLTNRENSVSLNIVNHTASNALTAYMMIANIREAYTSGTYTITLETNSGNIYVGTLEFKESYEDMPAGRCYTMIPKLAPVVAATISSSEGTLADKLNKLTLAPNINTLILNGYVNNTTDIAALGAFLKGETGAQIDTLKMPNLNLYNAGSISAPICTVTGLKDCTQLKAVELPLYATVIGTSAFEGCTSLKSIILPKFVKKIENRAFYGCSSLTGIACTFRFDASEGKTMEIADDLATNTTEDLKIFLPYNKGSQFDGNYGHSEFAYKLSVQLNRAVYYHANTDTMLLDPKFYKFYANGTGVTGPVLPPGGTVTD